MILHLVAVRGVQESLLTATDLDIHAGAQLTGCGLVSQTGHLPNFTSLKQLPPRIIVRKCELAHNSIQWRVCM